MAAGEQAGGEYTEEDASPIRKIIAKRMSESKRNAPHFYLSVDTDMAPCISFRSKRNDEGERKISYNDLIMKAVAVCLRKHPDCNVSYDEDKIRYYKAVNISLAVSVEGGLLTPTVTDCDKKSLETIHDESAALVEKARNRKLRPRDWMGGTFTITNLGMFGIEEFIAILNPPQAMILAVGAIRDVPVVNDGGIEAGKRMKMVLSCDHRAVDGAQGALFLSELKTVLEDPAAYLIDSDR
ncbi:MAG: 2-oxo acid dehydrogenase subunit E2 [Spirochaetes bacterium]|nr:2-oxo acid dehydrogenase subunit E2 [Spirochaetota bacterium]